MGWLITLAILVLIAVLPVGISVCYDADGFRAFVKAGFARIQVFPLPKKEKKPKKKTKKAQTPAKKQPAKKQPEEKKKGGSLTDFLPIVRLVLDLLDDFRRKLRVDVLEADLVLAGSDPCDLAINYGKICGALGNLWPRLEEFLTIKKRDVKVQCDFEGDKTRITARVDLTITIGRIFGIGIFHGVKIMKEFMNIMNKRKGGATT
jgi:hypothetical protein